MRRRFEKQLDKEMPFHLDAAAEEYIARGLPPEDARRRAMADFGAMELAREEVRDLRPFRWLEQLTRDLRYAARQMGHAPTFACTVIVTLAVAIGANATIFSVFVGQPSPFVTAGPVGDAGVSFGSAPQRSRRPRRAY